MILDNFSQSDRRVYVSLSMNSTLRASENGSFGFSDTEMNSFAYIAGKNPNVVLVDISEISFEVLHAF
jgi:hypothetical protein